MSDGEPFVGKVAAFITREHDAVLEIVVFDHPETDGAHAVQLPAGTIEPGEAPAVAALREAREETGLESLALDRALGEFRPRFALDEWVVAETVHGSERWLRHGMAARVVEHTGERALAVSRTGSERSWVPASSLTRNVVRYLFSLRPDGGTPEEWPHACDCGAPIRVYWLPLDEAARRLHPHQAEWLEAARAALAP